MSGVKSRQKSHSGLLWGVKIILIVATRLSLVKCISGQVKLWF